METITTQSGKKIAIISRNTPSTEGIHFITEDSNSLQLGINGYEQGQSIRPHIHIKRDFTIQDIQEVVHVDRGSIQVQFYDSDGTYLTLRELTTGDTVIFIDGGHGLKILEDTKIIEIKQGPYLGKEQDKVFIGEYK